VGAVVTGFSVFSFLFSVKDHEKKRNIGRLVYLLSLKNWYMRKFLGITLAAG
jgi:hypothetical protein